MRVLRGDGVHRKCLAHPVAQCLARATDFLCDRADRSVLRAVLALVLETHADRAGAELRGIRGCSLRHGSIRSRVGASDKPGAVQPSQFSTAEGSNCLALGRH